MHTLIHVYMCSNCGIIFNAIHFRKEKNKEGGQQPTTQTNKQPNIAELKELWSKCPVSHILILGCPKMFLFKIAAMNEYLKVMRFFLFWKSLETNKT